MLISLQNKQQKQRNTASVALSIFVGGWLLLFCQTCLALTGSIQEVDQTVDGIASSCHEPLSSNVSNFLSEKHCFGVCDCDVFTTLVSHEKTADSVKKTKYSLSLYDNVGTAITSVFKAPESYQIATSPEKSIQIPFRRYNVLLI